MIWKRMPNAHSASNYHDSWHVSPQETKERELTSPVEGRAIWLERFG